MKVDTTILSRIVQSMRYIAPKTTLKKFVGALCVSALFVGQVSATNLNFNATDTPALVTYEDVVGVLNGDTIPDAGLALDLNGAIGATEYCDENGLNCLSIAALGSDDQDLSWNDLTNTLDITDGSGVVISGFQDANIYLDDLADGSLSESAIDSLITRDSEWDTQAEVETIWGVSLATTTDLANVTIDTSQITDWASATSGFLTSYTETDPVFTAWDRSTGISITESQISDLQAYLTAESDPVWLAEKGDYLLTANTALWDQDASDDLALTSLSMGSGSSTMLIYNNTNGEFFFNDATILNNELEISTNIANISNNQGLITDLLGTLGVSSNDTDVTWVGTNYLPGSPSSIVAALENMDTQIASAISGINTTGDDLSDNVLSDLSDVTLTALADGEMLQYNSTSGDWENIDVSTWDQDASDDVTTTNFNSTLTGDASWTALSGTVSTNTGSIGTNATNIGTNTSAISDLQAATGVGAGTDVTWVGTNYLPGSPSTIVAALENMDTQIASAISGINTTGDDLSDNVLSDLSDVTLTALADGEMLQYNSTSGDWENIDVSGWDQDASDDITTSNFNSTLTGDASWTALEGRVTQNESDIADNVVSIGINVTNIATNALVLSDKATKVNFAVDGNLAGLDASGDLTDSGYAINDAGTGVGDLWSADKIATEIAAVTETDPVWSAEKGDYFLTASFSGAFDTDLATKTSDDLTEGTTNLYFTDTRATTAVGGVVNDGGTSTTDIWSADKVATEIATAVGGGTLQDVTTAGATTTDAITVGGLTVDTDTLHVDATNNRVGVGTTFPTAGLLLDVEGNVGAAAYCDENGANCKTIVELAGGAGSTGFLDLSDSPSSYVGHQGKAVVVNATGDGLEFVSAGTPSPLPIVRVSSTSTGTFTQAAPLTIPWDTEDEKDSGFTHNNVTNNTRITVDEAGTYQISGQVRVLEVTDQRAQYVVKVLVNGVDIGYPMGSGYIRNSQNSSDYWTLPIQSLPVKLNANDYIEVTVEIESQTTTTFDSALVGSESYLSMVQLQGLSGPQGAQGPQGIPGVDGINGVDGIDANQLWNENGSDIYFDTGNVGIGMSTTPTARLDVDGKIKSSDAIQMGSIANLLALPSCNSLNYGALYFVTSEEQVYVCTNDADQWKGVGAAGAGSTSQKVTLAPEYPGSTLTGDGSSNVGVMRSDFCENGAAAMPDINVSICDIAGDIHNYYSWTTSEATAQDYDIWVRWRVPAGFSWALTDPIKVWGKRTDATNNAVTVYVYDTAGVLENPGGTQVAGNSWTETSVESSFAGTYTEGEYITIRITMNADAGDSVQVGEISLDYLSQ